MMDTTWHHRAGRLVMLGLILVGVGCTAPKQESEPGGETEASAQEFLSRVIRHRNRGLAFLEQEKPGEAIPEFEQVVEMVPDDPLGYVNLAIAHLRRQDLAEALSWVGKGAKAAPKSAAVHSVKAQILEWQGDLEAADAARVQSLGYDPTNLRVRYAHARYLLGKGPEGVEEGLVQLQKLRELAPGNVVVLSELAIGLAEAGRLQDVQGPLHELARATGSEGEGAEFLDSAAENVQAGDAAVVVKDLRIATNLLRGREIYKLSSAQVRSDVVGFPLEQFQAAKFRGAAATSPPATEVRFSEPSPLPESFSLEFWLGSDGGRAAAVDLDEDGILDWVEAEGKRLHLPDGKVLSQERAISSVLASDLDHDGDLDLLATSFDGPIRFWRNDGASGWFNATVGSGLEQLVLATDVTAADLDGDTDLDLVTSKPVLTIAWNQRLGRFDARPTQILTTYLAVEDVSGNGCFDILFTGAWGKGLYWMEGDCSGSFQDAEKISDVSMDAIVPMDHDNDGRMDLVLAGVGDPGLKPGRMVILRGLGGGEFENVSDRLPETARADDLLPADVDEDGDLDLVILEHEGTTAERWLENQGGDALGWMQVELAASEASSAKINRHGIGSLLELWTGTRKQVRTVRQIRTHFGLAEAERADLLRVLWTNGVPQSTLEPASRAVLREEEVLKGSCPFLYAWDGEQFAFVTDLLWASPLGLPLPIPVRAEKEVVRAGWDSREFVKVLPRHTDTSVRPVDGLVRMRITEELWETAYFDKVALHVVDHPAKWIPLSNLKVQPPPYPEDVIRWAADPRPPAVALDGDGNDVLERVAAEDAVYLLGGRPTRYQGLRTPHTLELEPPEGFQGSLLLLTGWVFPTDASLNVALARSHEPAVRPPVLEYLDPRGRWVEVPGASPYPPGKTKTIVVDLPPEARGGKIRLRTNLDIRWDQVAFAKEVSGEGVLMAGLEPSKAELGYRGFSSLWREHPDGPHVFRYEEVSEEPAWPGIEGPFTRYGDVRPLLVGWDDEMVVMGPGDEIVLEFPALSDVPVPDGWVRSYFLESVGWDKDADINTLSGWKTEPLPCRAMSRYPSAEDCDPRARLEYLQIYQNRTGRGM